MVAGLSGGKMSSSVQGVFPQYSISSCVRLCLLRQIFFKILDSKIDLLDPPETISKKIRKAEATPRIVEDNGVIALAEYILLPAAALKGQKEFRVERKDNEPLVYTDIQQLKDDYTNDVVRVYQFKNTAKGF